MVFKLCELLLNSVQGLYMGPRAADTKSWLFCMALGMPWALSKYLLIDCFQQWDVTQRSASTFTWP